MGVCSPSGPLPAVLHAPTALGGARGDVCVAALSSGKALHCGFSDFSTGASPKTPSEHTPFLHMETVALSCRKWIHREIRPEPVLDY